MHQIIVIGTDPACPRCQLLKNIIKSKVHEMELAAEFIPLVYTSQEAETIAQSQGLQPGTAKAVAEALGVSVDSEAFTKLVENFKPDLENPYFPYNDCRWSVEMDELLKPLENRAIEAGIMMTPVLVIDGMIKHQGSVPKMSDLVGWLKEIQ